MKTQDIIASFNHLATEIGTLLGQQRMKLAVAESCTGGWIAQVITSAPGSSAWFERGFVTYSNEAKQDLVGVQLRSLEREGAVSQRVVREMAEGALRNSLAEVSIAVSGIAGPGGGTPDKPVGTVWLGWAALEKETRTLCQHFKGDREAIRAQTVQVALEQLKDFMK